MAIVPKFYGPFFKSLCSKEIDFDSDVFRLMLCTSAYVPNLGTHRYKSSVTNEIIGAGYTSGGTTIDSVTVSYDPFAKILRIDGADAVWSSSSFSARYAVLYDATPASDSTQPLICYYDFVADQSPSSGTFTVKWGGDGILGFGQPL